MLPWKFRTYVSPSGRKDVQVAIDKYNIKGKARFERAVKHLAVSPMPEWHEPHGKKLTDEDPLYEIRYQAFQRQERALGYFDDATHTFVIVLICNHKDRVYRPPDAFDSAHERIAWIRSGKATTTPLQVDGANFPEDGP